MILSNISDLKIKNSNNKVIKFSISNNNKKFAKNLKKIV